MFRFNGKGEYEISYKEEELDFLWLTLRLSQHPTHKKKLSKSEKAKKIILLPQPST